MSNGRKLSYALAALSICCLTSLSACVPERSYFEPKELPPEQVKTGLVSTPSPIFRGGKDLILIKTIDGEPPMFLESRAVVPPGEHIFQVQVELHKEDPKHPDRSIVTKADAPIVFEVQAERNYLIDAQEDEEGFVWIWAVEADTKVVVGGNPPRRSRRSAN